MSAGAGDEVASRRPEPPTAAAAGRVLLVEDDATVADVVVRYLRRAGFQVTWETDGAAALAHVLADLPDLVVLDLMLPALDGLEVCRALRARSPVPVVMLSARGDEDDRVRGLKLGADDYVTKPFSPRELVARIEAVLRRARAAAAGADATSGLAVLVSGDLVLDRRAREARRAGAPVPLTARELDLLAHLMAHPRRAFRREELLEEVWGWSYGDPATVTVHVRRLREKIEDDPALPARIATVWGVGYRWDG